MNAHDMAQTQRTDLAGFVGDIERLETIFATWDETQQAAVGAYRLRDRGAEWRSVAPIDPGAEDRSRRARRDEECASPTKSSMRCCGGMTSSSPV